jgi:hypothetical protein
MSNWVTGVVCVLFLLAFIVAGYMIASDWIKMVVQQVRFGRGMYAEFKADKQEWERNKASQGDTAPQGGDTMRSSAISPDESSSGRP